MRNLPNRGMLLAVFFLAILLFSSGVYSIVDYPYSSGQVIFVQSPYNSSLYTNYNYNAHESAPQRLPNYTTNQAVFVQQPYATTNQTVASYPSKYFDNLPRTESRYMTPAAYPTTVAPAYPFANATGGYPASPYPTTSQTSVYNYPYQARDTTTVYTYPYTSTAQTTTFPPPTIERVPSSYSAGYTKTYGSPGSAQQTIPAFTGNLYQGHPSATYSAYPTTTVTKYPYPITSSANPETIIQPVKKVSR